MKKMLILAFMGAILSLAASCYAGEIDLLLQKLVEKKVLTPGEAQEILAETREEVKKEIAEITESITERMEKTKTPSMTLGLTGAPEKRGSMMRCG